MLDEDPIKAARYLGDTHLITTITDACQILANQFTLTELFLSAPRTTGNRARSHVSTKHPCSVWASQSIHNLRWIITYCDEMLQEYHRRFPERNNSFSQARSFLEWVKSIVSGGYPEEAIRPFPIKLPSNACCIEYQQFEMVNDVEQYRLFYVCDKIFVRWELGRPEPKWHENAMKSPEIKTLRRERMRRV